MDDLTPDELFASAVQAYFKRDPRPLGRFVLTNDMTTEQRDFVAKALCGDIEQADGRTVKPTTEEIMHLFYLIQAFEEFHGKTINKSLIAGFIAQKLGYDDAESVRRAIYRHDGKMPNPIPPPKASVDL